MIRFPRLLVRGAVGAVLALLTACATQRGPLIRSDYDRTVDFSAYQTFGFPDNMGTDRGGYTTLVTSHFKDAVRREMTLRGYTYSESAPQLLVNFYQESRDRTRIYSYPGWGPPWWGWGHGFYRPRYGFYSAWPFFYDDLEVVQYRTGTIRVDVIDAARKQVVWEASAEEQLTDAAQDNPQPMIARLVTELFRKFPRSGSTASPQ